MSRHVVSKAERLARHRRGNRRRHHAMVTPTGDDPVRYGAPAPRPPEVAALDELIEAANHQVRRIIRRIGETTDPVRLAVLRDNEAKTRKTVRPAPR